jgi:hypothetical protein
MTSCRAGTASSLLKESGCMTTDYEVTGSIPGNSTILNVN